MSYTDTASPCRGSARPRTVARHLATAATLAVATCLSFTPVAGAHGRGCAGAHTPIAAASRAAIKRAVVCLIDRQRRAHGLPGLQANRELNRSAQGWTNVMVSDHDFSHGANFSARISAVGFDWSSVGENIATGFTTPSAVVHAWMASTGHCQNILNPTYRYVGTGVDLKSAGAGEGPGTWTQDFGLLMGQHAASGNWGPASGCPYR